MELRHENKFSIFNEIDEIKLIPQTQNLWVTVDKSCNYKEYKQIIDLHVIVNTKLVNRNRKNTKWKSNSYYLCDNLIYKFSVQFIKQNKSLIKVLYFSINLEIEFFNIFNKCNKFQQNIFDYGFMLQKHHSSYCLFTHELNQFNIWKKYLSKMAIQHHFFENYLIKKVIGRGSFADVYFIKWVYLAIQKITQKSYAAKAFHKDKLQLQQKGIVYFLKLFFNEIKIMRLLNHPNINKLYEVYETEQQIFLILQLVTGGDLKKKIKNQEISSIKQVKVIISNLLNAVLFMHQLNIAHRDIKLENILFKTPNSLDLQLADFGLSTELDGNSNLLFQRCGTPGYVAPEILSYYSTDQIYTTAVDIFSCGIILYVLLAKQKPFSGKSYNEILQKNKICNIQFDNSIFQSQLLVDENELISLLKAMLQKNPQQRPNALQCLNHPSLKTQFQIKQKQLSDDNLTYKIDSNNSIRASQNEKIEMESILEDKERNDNNDLQNKNSSSSETSSQMFQEEDKQEKRKYVRKEKIKTKTIFQNQKKNLNERFQRNKKKSPTWVPSSTLQQQEKLNQFQLNQIIKQLKEKTPTKVYYSPQIAQSKNFSKYKYLDADILFSPFTLASTCNISSAKMQNYRKSALKRAQNDQMIKKTNFVNLIDEISSLNYIPSQLTIETSQQCKPNQLICQQSLYHGEIKTFNEIPNLDQMQQQLQQKQENLEQLQLQFQKSNKTRSNDKEIKDAISAIEKSEKQQILDQDEEIRKSGSFSTFKIIPKKMQINIQKKLESRKESKQNQQLQEQSKTGPQKSKFSNFKTKKRVYFQSNQYESQLYQSQINEVNDTQK